MLYENNTTKLLGLEDVILKDVWEESGERHIKIELPRKDHSCPECNTSTGIVHDYREQKIKDISSFGSKTILHLRKRRYRCPECGKRFYEKIPFLPRYYRITKRLFMNIINELRDLVSATCVAARNNVSVTSVLRYFNVIQYSCRSLPEVLSIDEFKGNAGGEKYQSIIADVKHRKILDILPNRKSEDLIRYFNGFSTKNSVKYVVMDMNRAYLEIARLCFPSATVVIDKYHVTRQAIWAFENVRISEQKKFSDYRRKYFKRSRSLLNKHSSKLTQEEADIVSVMLQCSSRLREAYYLKNKFQEFMWSKDSIEGRRKLAEWILLAELAKLPEFNACLTAVHNWGIYILNAFDCGYTNGFTEGCNNKTKVLKRLSFGVRNYKRFKNRILHCSATV